jgi:radical SAM superfamily enzyme YgiQ (UPF0313 family)
VRSRSRVLFVQLPQLDNAVEGPHENLNLAAVYLRHALEKSAEARRYEPEFLTSQADAWDDAHVIDEIVRFDPAVIAGTLYLWNVERTLDVLREVRRRSPGVRVVVGGPEVAEAHPFLFRSPAIDAAVVGEGEAVFPAVLKSLQTRRTPDLKPVAWRARNGFVWGAGDPPVPSLHDMLPPPGHTLLRPDANGMAYLEASRGCPLRCSYCLYHQYRRGLSAITPREVISRLRHLRQRGARDIRFVDPTFNAHPAFEQIVRELARFNASGGLDFFAEMRPESITDEQARHLAAARFTEIEVGIQSAEPRVLSGIRRPTDLVAAGRGIRRLARHGINVTVDLMYGLPGQTLDGFKRSVDWARGLGRVKLQCLQTLLLPGTDLRRHRTRTGISAISQPPYGVVATATMGDDAMREAERCVQAASPVALDSAASRFVGCALPDLFAERVCLRVPTDLAQERAAGAMSRRVLQFHGPDLFSHRAAIARFVRRAVGQEPHILWQFVLVPDWEEPLDLLDALIREIRRMPLHILDRYSGVMSTGERAARRVFVQLRKGRRYDPSWVEAAERTLRAAFH